MDSEKITVKIEERILEINKTTPGYWPTSFYDKDFEDDVDTLEVSLMKVKRWLKVSVIILSAIEIILLIGLLIMKYAILNRLNIDGQIVFIVLTFQFVRSIYNLHTIKLNLENKIFLVRLLEQIKS
ncbi:MAG TPA: hypothetical protein VIK55_01760 [Paludibacter sp.]